VEQADSCQTERNRAIKKEREEAERSTQSSTMASLASSSSSAGLTRAPTMLEQLLEEINFQRTKELRQMLKDGSYFEHSGDVCLFRFSAITARAYASPLLLPGVRTCTDNSGCAASGELHEGCSALEGLADGENNKTALLGFVWGKKRKGCSEKAK